MNQLQTQYQDAYLLLQMRLLRASLQIVLVVSCSFLICWHLCYVVFFVLFCEVCFRFTCFTFYEHIKCIDRWTKGDQEQVHHHDLDWLLFSRWGLAFCVIARCMFAFALNPTVANKMWLKMWLKWCLLWHKRTLTHTKNNKSKYLLIYLALERL